VASHGFTVNYHSIKCYVRKLRGKQSPEAQVVIQDKDHGMTLYHEFLQKAIIDALTIVMVRIKEFLSTCFQDGFRVKALLNGFRLL
jgi:hypothetical protein